MIVNAGIAARTALVGAALLSLTACDKAMWESVPMQVRTAQGDVICQLYSRNELVWDTSIAGPKGMTKDQADEVCLAEGKRVKADPSIIAMEVPRASASSAPRAPTAAEPH